jgi:hypothetical protein
MLYVRVLKAVYTLSTFLKSLAGKTSISDEAQVDAQKYGLSCIYTDYKYLYVYIILFYVYIYTQYIYIYILGSGLFGPVG